MTLILFSGAWGKMIHEKILKQEIPWYCPLNNIRENIQYRFFALVLLLKQTVLLLILLWYILGLLCVSILCRDGKFLTFLLLAFSFKFVKFKTAKCNTQGWLNPTKAAFCFIQTFVGSIFQLRISNSTLSVALYIASGLRLLISESVYSPLFRCFSDCSKD